MARRPKPAAPRPQTPAELKARADVVKRQRDAADAREAARKKAAHDKKVADKVAECHAAMRRAADEGRYSVEVDIDGDVFNDVARELTAYRPRAFGDGYGHNVINLRFDG